MSRKIIGTRAEALLVHRHGIWSDDFEECEEGEASGYNMPSEISRELRIAQRKRSTLMKYGFRFLGNGTYRSAWLSPDDTTVYKRDRTNYSDDGGNISEYYNLKAISSLDLPATWAIPKFDIFRFTGENIIAMEYIQPGECDIDDMDFDGCHDVFQGIVDDFHGLNIIQRSGVRYLIDAGI